MHKNVKTKIFNKLNMVNLQSKLAGEEQTGECTNL